MSRMEATESSQARQSANSSLILSLSFFLIARENSPISSTSQLNVLSNPRLESFSKYIFLIRSWYLFRSILYTSYGVGRFREAIRWAFPSVDKRNRLTRPYRISQPILPQSYAYQLFPVFAETRNEIQWTEMWESSCIQNNYN